MVTLTPFKGTRPFNSDAKNIIAPSTDHLSEENIKKINDKNYWNYLKILNPVDQFKENDTFLIAKNHFNEMKKNEVIKKDDNVSFYIYQISLHDHVQLGFLALANIDDFLSNKIKSHENTHKKKIQDRANQMINIEAQIGPIYMSYPDNKKIEFMLESFLKRIPNYDFESFDHSHHKLWCISNKLDIDKISKEIKNIKSLYIADGHHRMGAMNLISQNYKKQKQKCNNFMIAAFSASQSKIYDYNRVIINLNNLTENDFLKKLRKNFKISLRNFSIKPKNNKKFGMYYNGKWYLLEFIGKLTNEYDILESLDINIINNYCLIPILGIDDVNNDKRICFIPGCHGLNSLKKKVDENYGSVAFSIFPSQIQDVINVADNNLTMPPKSTWFDPKPLDGLVVYEFNQTIYK